MRKLLLLLTLCLGLSTVAQTDGLVYQAVILDPNAQDIPGEDVTGNVLPNSDLLVRFTIEGINGVDYQEIQQATTDRFGMIKLIIGSGEASVGVFDEIDWNGTRKDLTVEIDLGQSFETLSKQQLLFLPFSFHRNITATGTLEVIGSVLLKSDLEVNGTSNLNDGLRVRLENPVVLSGTLEVDGRSTLKDSLTVTGANTTMLDGSLAVGLETQLDQTLDVEEATLLKNTLVVESTTTLNDGLRVTNQQPTLLTGTLSVDGRSDFNNAVNINNGSPLNLSGDLSVNGAVTFNSDLTVEGDTNLNRSLSVNNTSPTNLSGTLDVGGQATLNDILLVEGATNLENILRVNNESSTYLTGTLTVGLSTNLNSGLFVYNGSPTLLTGPLNVNGEIDFGSELTVAGITNLFGDLFVNNGSETNLSGTLGVDGTSSLMGTLDVQDATTMNNDLTVANQSDTYLSGTLEVDGVTTLNNSLEVLNISPTNLNGDMTVDGTTLLNDNVGVSNNTPTVLTGLLTVEGATNLNNSLNVTNTSPTNFTGDVFVADLASLNNTLDVTNGNGTRLTGSLDVDGVSTLQSMVTINAATVINNDLTVTMNGDFNQLNAEALTVERDASEFLATFSNTIDDNGAGDGIKITLGSNHGRFFNGSLLTIDQTLINPGPPTNGGGTYDNALVTVKNALAAAVPEFTVGDIIGLLPSFRDFGVVNINNIVLQEINVQLGLPKNLPSVNFPGYEITIPGNPLPLTIFPGTPRICSGQECWRVCFPFAGCTRICVPPVDICVPRIPRITIPRLTVPSFNLRDFAEFLPQLPVLSAPPLPNVEIPAILNFEIPETLSSENHYMTFQDVNNLEVGAIKAQSLEDFADNTIFDDVYVFNVAAEFVGVDLPNGIAKGGAAMVKLISEFNKLGVEYASGNGDYAEWLEREDADEYLTAGDIVAVKGGKITKDISNFEQLMIVSHRPIVHGNAPEQNNKHLGNAVAFIGQVPAKVIGPVRSGDYIVAKGSISGYGVAVSPLEMTTEDFRLMVGRSWENNENEGPKVVNTVVGLQNGDFSERVKILQQLQLNLDKKLETLEERIARITGQLQLSEKNKETYAAKE